MDKKKKPSKSVITYIIGKIHLWLGLASGLVVFIVSITGCLFSFQQEISNVYYHHTFFVNPQQHPRLPLSQLKQSAQNALGASEPINNITTYKQPDRAWEFMAYKTNDTSVTYFGEIEYFRSVFINPYTGKITGFRNYKYDFFNIVKYLHWSLLLSTPYGQPIVGWSTLIFVILLISGLVLWWPKKWNKANRKRSFKIMWRARFKRLNYDLHNVLGFYSLILALVLALTGMIFSFQWFSKLSYAAAAGTTEAPKTSVVKSVKETFNIENQPIDIAFNNAIHQAPSAKRFGITPAQGQAGVIYIYAYKGKETYYDYDMLQYDQYSGKLLQRKDEDERNNGEQLIAMNYDIHVGAIGGLTGKIIAFIISLICASLPVTGFFVWWNKHYNKNYKKSFG